MSYPSSHQEQLQRESHIDAFGKRVAARLNLGLDEIEPDNVERLRFARVQALSKRRAAPMQAVPVYERERAANLAMAAGRGAGGDGREGAALWGVLLFVLVMACALVGVNDWTQQVAEQEIVDIDSELLLDVLPPHAYMDPGFNQYLRKGVEP